MEMPVLRNHAKGRRVAEGALMARTWNNKEGASAKTYFDGAHQSGKGGGGCSTLMDIASSGLEGAE